MSEEKKLLVLRDRIDTVDKQIQSLLNERAQIAIDVATVKRGLGDTAFYRPDREAQILRNIMTRNAGVLSNKEVGRLFREIMSACLALEQPLKIAFLGPAGTYSQAAALKHFGHSVETTPVAAIDEVFREVESKSAHYGVVPVENSTEGGVSHTLDLFLRSPLKICGEVELRIHHYVLSRESSLDDIDIVYSHQQSLAQCREWLDTNLLGKERVAVGSNAEATALAKQQPRSAAVAGEVTAKLYELNILARNIEDEPQNTTRFLVIGEQLTRPSGKDKTSLVISTNNTPGSLARLIAPFGQQGLSMTRIESRPSRRDMWDYVYFVDVTGHVDDEAMQVVFADIQQETTMFKVLGSYPMATL